MNPAQSFTLAMDLVAKAAEFYGIEPSSIRRTGGMRRHFKARFAVIWALRQLRKQNQYRYSYEHIARLLGFADHTTPQYAVKRGFVLRETDPEFRRLTDSLLTLGVLQSIDRAA